MTTPTTPFLEAAMNFETGNTFQRGCCDELSRITNQNTTVRKFFEKNFKPRRKERILYNANFLYWLQGNHEYAHDVLQDRIIALLFAHHLWLDQTQNPQQHE